MSQACLFPLAAPFLPGLSEHGSQGKCWTGCRPTSRPSGLHTVVPLPSRRALGHPALPPPSVAHFGPGFLTTQPTAAGALTARAGHAVLRRRGSPTGRSLTRTGGWLCAPPASPRQTDPYHCCWPSKHPSLLSPRTLPGARARIPPCLSPYRIPVRESQEPLPSDTRSPGAPANGVRVSPAVKETNWCRNT